MILSKPDICVVSLMGFDLLRRENITVQCETLPGKLSGLYCAQLDASRYRLQAVLMLPCPLDKQANVFEEDYQGDQGVMCWGRKIFGFGREVEATGTRSFMVLTRWIESNKR